MPMTGKHTEDKLLILWESEIKRDSKVVLKIQGFMEDC
jgi:hypothetical protein